LLFDGYLDIVQSPH